MVTTWGGGGQPEHFLTNLTFKNVFAELYMSIFKHR
jgi:hypothetical protein